MLYAPPKHARLDHDHYATPPELTAALVIGLDRLGVELPIPILDPCCGDGALLATLASLIGVAGFSPDLIFGSDLLPNGYPRRQWIHEDPIDARDHGEVYEVLGGCRAVVTNPPTEDSKVLKRSGRPRNALERRYRKTWRPYAKKELAADIASAGM